MSNLLKSNNNNINIDINNFVYFIISTLHEELNQSEENNNTDNISNNNDSFNQEFNKFYTNYKSNFNSIVSKLFYAIQLTETTCLRCNNTQYNFQTYFLLNFPLFDVKKYAINKSQIQKQYLMSLNNNNLNMNNINKKILNLSNNIVDIFDCFDYFQKIETLSNDNGINCYNCHQYSEANYSTKLYNSPKILIMIFDIENDLQNIKINFPLELDLNTYFFDKNIKHQFKLISVVSYIFINIQKWFLISHCLSPIDNKWYTYNDSTVNEVYDIESQILNYGLPYLLVYQKVA